MLTKDGVTARYIEAFCLFLLSGSEMITGWPATVCGILGTLELATALLGYSPLYELYNRRQADKHLNMKNNSV